MQIYRKMMEQRILIDKTLFNPRLVVINMQNYAIKLSFDFVTIGILIWIQSK